MKWSVNSKFWLLAFVIYGTPNFLLYLFTVETEIILVDLVPVSSTLGLLELSGCIVLVMLSFWFVKFCSRLGEKFFHDKQSVSLPKGVGVLVFLVQMIGLLAVLLSDFGRVGGEGSSSSFIAILSSYLYCDMVFFAYYGHARSSRVPYVNLMLFAFSMLVRGWAGLWLMLFFIEFYYLAQRMSGRKLLKRLLLIVALTVASYPMLIQLKETARTVNNVGAFVESKEFVVSMGELLVRLQHFTSVALITQNSTTIKNSLERGEIIPFYADIPIISKFKLPQVGYTSLQKYLSVQYLLEGSNNSAQESFDDYGWYVHVGIAGWLMVLEWPIIPFYLLFVAVLIVLPYLVAGRFVGARSMLPVLHIATLLYAFHGWYGPQFNFLLGLIIYSLMLNIYRYLFCYHSGASIINLQPKL